MCKKLIISVGAAAVLACVLIGPQTVVSHLRNAASLVSEEVQNSVPVEYELERAERMIKEISPEIDDLEKVVATEQVEIKDLKLKIATGHRQQETLLSRMRVQRERLDSATAASFEIAGRQMSRAKLERILSQHLSRWKITKRTVESDERLLAAREEALGAAVKQLDSAKAQQTQLRNLVEELRAQVREMKARESIETRSTIDESKLAETRELLQRLKKRVDVSRQLQENRASGAPLGEEETGVSACDEYDRLFGGEKKDGKRDT